MTETKTCKLDGCSGEFGPKPYSAGTGSKRMNYYAFERRDYCSKKCGQIAAAQIKARKNEVRQRYARMLRKRLQRASKQFLGVGL